MEHHLLLESFQEKLKKALLGPVDMLLYGGDDMTWPVIRRILSKETEKAVSRFSKALASFDLDEITKDQMLNDLENYGRGVVEAKAKEESRRVLKRMKARFSMMFSQDVWTGLKDIREITRIALSGVLKLLSVMAAIRLDDEVDNIEKTLLSTLLKEGGSFQKTDPLASSTWDEVPPEKTLITPVQCKCLWIQFKNETEYIVATKAISAQEANKRANILAVLVFLLLVLGFNGFMTLLRNPLDLALFLVVSLFFRALWMLLEVCACRGILPRHGALSAKFVPTVKNILQKLNKEGKMPAPNNAQRIRGLFN